MSSNIYSSFVYREQNGDENLNFQHTYHVTLDHIKKLALTTELQGHQGCVNCLSWNRSGDLLVSGSDDAQLKLWDVHNHTNVLSINTSHAGNVFSAKFLGRNDRLVSGAADCQIRIHDVNNTDSPEVIRCHDGRVKRLAVSDDDVNLFWSCSEDGTVRQFDLRDRGHFSDKHTVLVDLTKHAGSNSEVKCISINPVFSHQLAMGANDAYARVFDRRKICQRLLSWGSKDDLLDGCVDYYAAGHLREVRGRSRRLLAATYVSFSPDGRELLLNLGGEQAYIFPLHNNQQQHINLLPPHLPDASGDVIKTHEEIHDVIKSTNGLSNGYRKSLSPDINLIQPSSLFSTSSSSSSSVSSCDVFPPSHKKIRQETVMLVEEMRKKAGELFNAGKYSQAINIYNTCIHLQNDSSVLYCNRAICLYKRAWDGDTYAAARDCCAAIQLDDSNFKAYFRLVKCLIALHWWQEASGWLQKVRLKFPQNKEISSLETDLKKSTDKNKQTQRTEGLEQISKMEKMFRERSMDYAQRFCGHCNTTTDIKEANFLGSKGDFVVAGSDDGSFFIWQRSTSNIVRILNADSSIVNCLEPHPTTCLLASSGIESVVRLWSVQESKKDDREVADSDMVAQSNQTRMNLDPLELVLLSMGYRISPEEDPHQEPQHSPSNCRTS